MVYLLEMVIFHGYVTNNQMVVPVQISLLKMVFNNILLMALILSMDMLSMVIMWYHWHMVLTTINRLGLRNLPSIYGINHYQQI